MVKRCLLHNKNVNCCKLCKELGIGGAYLCDHYFVKPNCVQCKIEGTGGSYICEHFRRKFDCTKCLMILETPTRFYHPPINKCENCQKYTLCTNCLFQIWIKHEPPSHTLNHT